jgi:hypothetical protein
MNTPVIRVEIGFQQTLAFSQPFQLNNAVYGLLDTGTLGGIEMVDVTEYVQTINIQRGRNRQLDQFNAGTAVVSLWNQQRIFDPLNADSPYFGVIVPRTPIDVYANDTQIFSGVVSDWDIDYDIANKDIVYLNCSDVFTVFANQSLNGGTTVTQSSSARVEAVLDLPEVAYQGPRRIGVGSSTLGGTSLNTGFSYPANTNVLNYLQTIAKSEQGYLFISRDGTTVFKGRTEVLNPVADAIFSDTGTGIKYQTLENQFGDELLYNYIRAESPSGTAQTASNETSINLYQSQVLDETNLLNSTTTEVLGLAQYLLGKYKDPILRFTGITVELSTLTVAHQATCLQLDMTEIVEVTKSFAVGNPATVTQTLIVSGVNHTIRPGQHTITYTFESTDGNQYLTLDDTIFGILDQNLLAF